jgi:hypothetical protein
MRPIVLQEVFLEEKPGRLIAVFTLSERPGRRWIAFFRERAWYSVLDAASARFSRNQARVDLLRREDLEPLIRSVQQFIEGANLDAELAGPP